MPLRRLITTICLITLFTQLIAITSAQNNCDGAPPPNLTIGGTGRIGLGLDINMRTTPDTQGEFLRALQPGQGFSVQAGPICADGYNWWQITLDGTTGWAAEGIGSDYWLVSSDFATAVPVATHTPLPPPVPPQATDAPPPTPLPMLPPVQAPTQAAPPPLPPAQTREPGELPPTSNRVTIAVKEGDPIYVRPSDVFHIIEVDVVTGQRSELFSVAGINNDTLTWSRDGSTLAFIKDERIIMAYQADTGELLQLYVLPPSYPLGCFRLTWSPDNTKILCDTPATGEYSAGIFDLTTGEMTDLLISEQSNGNTNGDPWSPDGRYIVMQLLEQIPSALWGIYVYDVQTGERITVIEDQYTGGTAWLPDGRLYYQTAGGNQQLLAWDAGTRQTTTLARSNAISRIQSNFATGNIAYMNFLGQHQYLYVDTPQFNAAQPVSDLPQRPWSFTWSPDGQYLAFVDYASDLNEALMTQFAVPVTGGAPILIVDDPQVSMRKPVWRP